MRSLTTTTLLLVILAVVTATTVLALPNPKGEEDVPVETSDAKLGDDESGKAALKKGGRCWTNRNGEWAPRWYEEGEQIEIGSFFYNCRNIKLVLAGCITETGQKVPLNDTFVDGTHVVQCARWGDGLTLRTIGCVPESQGNQTFMVGDSWVNTEAHTWWECALEGVLAKARLGGCVDSESNRLKLGESIDKEHTTFECQMKQWESAELVAVGCVLNGSHYKVGQQWQDGDYLFYCKRTKEGSCEKTCIGCVHNGHRLYDGDRVRKERSVLQCEIREKRHSLSPVACVSGRIVERAVGCVWNEASPDGTYRVKRRCLVRDELADIETLGCLFEKDGMHRLTLKPDTYTLWRGSMDEPALGVLCRNSVVDGEVWPQLETFPLEEATNRTAGLMESTDQRL